MDFENKIIYQIYPKSFNDSNGDGIGDINGIIEKLDYLKNLGVDYIWLSPINKSPQKDNGYDISDYYMIDEMFGTEDDYLNLIKKANALDIKIMLDLVLNHVSTKHEWFKKAEKNIKPYVDYFIWSDEKNDLQGYFSNSAWTYNEKMQKYYFSLFDESQADLNWHNKEVRYELYKMINFWIDLGVEGFRLDVIDLIGKEPLNNITAKGPKFYEYLEELNLNTFKNKFLTVGECWNASLSDAKSMTQENRLSQVFTFNHLITTNVNDKWTQKSPDVIEIMEIIKNWHNNYDGIDAMVMNNHDLPRLISLWLPDVTHNIASKMLLSIFGLLRGNLYIYQGEEIGMSNITWQDINDFKDVETLNAYFTVKNENIDEKLIMEKIRKVSRDNARTPMQWDEQIFGGFSSSEPWIQLNENYKNVNVKSDLLSSESIIKYYQEIINFRKNNYGIISEKLDYTYKNGILTIDRPSLIVVVDFNNNEYSYEIV